MPKPIGWSHYSPASRAFWNFLMGSLHFFIIVMLAITAVPAAIVYGAILCHRPVLNGYRRVQEARHAY